MSFATLERCIAVYLENAGLGIFSTSDPDLRTIYIGDMPDSVVEGIKIITVPGRPPHQYVDTEYHTIDFWTRSPHTDRAAELSSRIMDLLHRNYAYTIANWHIWFSESLGTPVDGDRDANGSKLFRVSIQFHCRNLNHIS